MQILLLEYESPIYSYISSREVYDRDQVNPALIEFLQFLLIKKKHVKGLSKTMIEKGRSTDLYGL